MSDRHYEALQNEVKRLQACKSAYEKQLTTYREEQMQLRAEIREWKVAATPIDKGADSTRMTPEALTNRCREDGNLISHYHGKSNTSRADAMEECAKLLDDAVARAESCAMADEGCPSRWLEDTAEDIRELKDKPHE